MNFIKKMLKNVILKSLATRGKIRKIPKAENDRCFIIGNGPSLRLADLEMLKNEDCFASNRIYKIFDKTDWRPKYYVSQDTRVLDEISSDIDVILRQSEFVFLNSYIRFKKHFSRNNLIYFYLDTADPYPELPYFSERPDLKIYEGFTVTYACIQLALYFGYKKIYLLGVDHNYNIDKLPDGRVVIKENVENYMTGLEGKNHFPPVLTKTTNAYNKAKDYCEKNNIEIFNATRGGKLEVFERVSFDQLFEDGGCLFR